MTRRPEGFQSPGNGTAFTCRETAAGRAKTSSTGTRPFCAEARRPARLQHFISSTGSTSAQARARSARGIAPQASRTLAKQPTSTHARMFTSVHAHHLQAQTHPPARRRAHAPHAPGTPLSMHSRSLRNGCRNPLECRPARSAVQCRARPARHRGGWRGARRDGLWEFRPPPGKPPRRLSDLPPQLSRSSEGVQAYLPAGSDEQFEWRI